MKKIVSVLLCMCMVFSMCAVNVCAAEKTAISCKDDLASLNADVPVIFVDGLSGEYYKGLSTETEDDDVRIWGPSTDVILDVVKENIISLLWNIIIKDYDKIVDICTVAADKIFGDFACDGNGTPNPDTGKKDKSTTELKSSNGYDNSYRFVYDWRLDMSTISAQLDEYVNYVMDLTGSDKVAFVAMSMGNAVLTTYLYEYYYTAEDYAERNHIDSVVFLAGAMNGVSTCEDGFSGNMSIDSTSILRMMSELMRDNEDTKGIYYAVEILYSLGLLEPITKFADNLTQELLANGFENAVMGTIGTITGFYALMDAERYAQAKELIFNTPEKKAKYAKIIENSDYYHNCVQANNVNVIQSLLDDGVKAAIIAEYGCTIIPITSDNDRMSDGTIATDRESFGATCAEVDGTLGEGYVQAKVCACGKNHISADNQIDASTCAFPDITWFGKYLRHSADGKYWANLIDLIIFSDEQVTVWDYTEYPQFLVNLDGNGLVPLTADNAGEVLPYEDTTLMGGFFSKFKK